MVTKEIGVVGILVQTYQVIKIKDTELLINQVVENVKNIVRPIMEDSSGIIGPSVVSEPSEVIYTWDLTPNVGREVMPFMQAKVFVRGMVDVILQNLR